MRSVVTLGLVLSLACKADRPAQQAPAPGPAPPPRDADRAEPGSVNQPSSDAAPAPGHVFLPRSPSTPPHRTTRPLAPPELARLSSIEHKDFRREVRGQTDRVVEVRHTTTTRPYLGVTVTIEACGQASAPKHPRPARAGASPPGRPCLAMALATWQARSDELRRGTVSAQLVDRPDTRFELGAREIDGATAIYTYQLGHHVGNDEHGQPIGSYSDAYILYYNDGVNQIRVNAAYVDDAVGSMAQLTALAPKEDLETLAVAFMRFYVHAWE